MPYARLRFYPPDRPTYAETDPISEDNVYDEELARIALARAELLNETAFVSEGAEALDYLFRHGEYATRPLTNPSLVILDLKMPKVDGIEVLRAIRAEPDTAQIPVVM